jgi:crotonobetainyl-CoA:carnitine CoA-transferase CaiB-like acyl-CoA transferase
MYAAAAIMAGLLERSRTGRGRAIEVSLLDTQVAGLANQAINWLAAGQNPQPMGSDHPNVAPYGAFATATRYIVVAIGSDRQFRALTSLLGHPEWSEDQRFASNAGRVAHRETLREEIEALLRTRPADQWLLEMQSAGVPCAPVLDVSEVFSDEEVRGRMVSMVAATELGPVPQVRSPLRIDGQPLENLSAPPALGEHTREIVEHVIGRLDSAPADPSPGGPR